MARASPAFLTRWLCLLQLVSVALLLLTYIYVFTTASGEKQRYASGGQLRPGDQQLIEIKDKLIVGTDGQTDAGNQQAKPDGAGKKNTGKGPPDESTLQSNQPIEKERTKTDNSVRHNGSGKAGKTNDKQNHPKDQRHEGARTKEKQFKDKKPQPKHKKAKAEQQKQKDKKAKAEQQKQKDKKAKGKQTKPTKKKPKTKAKQDEAIRIPPATFEIPHILHHTFASEMVYENYRPLISRCLKLNPDWTYYLWRDSDAKAIISKEYPQYWKTYTRFKDNLQRSDAIRYVILHRFGGIYLDMDVECLQPFPSSLTRQAAFLDQERLEQTRIFWRRDFSAMNSVMGSVPGHPFYKAMADRVLTKNTGTSAFSTTGPKVLTEFFKEYKESPTSWIWPVTLLPPSVASPLMDNQKNWKWLCRKAKKLGSSGFGWADIGCRMLETKNWHLGSADKSTIVVHRFLHLGYHSHHRKRRPRFDASKEFKSRVKFYH
ncbi:hypothetical protein BOX15_Mlig028735g1 [Macrostomum lignano]|uniref:Alpha 1,4-glycosyltransferase domain-containing protein n=1 Tax=Macrostomum lignano TaxID=282301 RepID=A0A267DUH6_9PLAT|nr:hypothetical protein BOX15_Mlig028735g1 [Macrostomum lignano]